MPRRNEEKVIIDIGKDGGIKVSGDGYKGEACTLATRDFSKALGEIESDTPTDEMYERPAEQEQYQTA